MNKTDDYRLTPDDDAISQVEKHVERLFCQWSINEIYLGNVLTTFSNLIALVLEHPDHVDIIIKAQLKGDVITFVISGVFDPFLKLFLREHFLHDILDNSSQSVFLIQKIADKVKVEGENLILCFNVGALPEVYYADRKNVFSGYYQNIYSSLND